MSLPPLLRRLNALHLIALGLIGSPLLVLLMLGVAWLWQAEQRWWWLGGMAAVVAGGYLLHAGLARRERRLLEAGEIRPDPAWPPGAESTWEKVEAFAASVEPADWPVGDGSAMLALGRHTLELVARDHHPEAERPLLELTLPHTLLIIERASRDLRKELLTNVPFSHRLGIGDLMRLRRWGQNAARLYDVYRAGRLVASPLEALLGELKGQLFGLTVGSARDDLLRWLLQTYVRRVGWYAVALYGGQLSLEDGDPVAAPTPASTSDLVQAKDGDAPVEPLRIVIAGRRNAGKSSLVNALFGELVSATDVLGDTTREISPRLLVRDGITRALVFDTPGVDAGEVALQALTKACEGADLLLWVSPAHRPDREREREWLDALRAARSSAKHPPLPLLVVMSHVDQLRPIGEWQPPYDLADVARPKVANMRAALEAVAADLGVQVEKVVPACLAPGRVYNIDDALWAALLSEQDAMLRSRLLRCLDARRQAENWGLVWKQLQGAGRWLWNRHVERS